MSSHNMNTTDLDLKIDNKFNDIDIPVITIDSDEEEEYNDNDIEIIEEKYHSNCSVDNNKPSIGSKPIIISNESTKAERLANNSINPLISESKIRISPKKRIITTKVESIASTSVSNNLDTNNESIVEKTSDNTIATNDVPPNKVQRLIGPKIKPNEVKEDMNQLYKNYLKSFRDRMNAMNNSDNNKTEELINKLVEIVMQLKRDNPHFTTSKQFAKLMKAFARDVSEEKNEDLVVRHHNDLLMELNRMVLKPNCSGNQLKLSKNIKLKRINKLTETIKRLQKEIFALENEELDYEAMNGNSAYSRLPKLYIKIEEVWVKREELLKRSTHMFRVLFNKLKYDSTPYPEINSAVENLFNNFIKKLKNWNKKGYRDETFNFIDVHKAITQVIQDKGLEIRNTNELIEEIYRDLLTELRTRRYQESEDVFETLETLEDLRPESFVANDPAIDIELSKNKSFFEKQMQELFQKFAEKDRAKNGDCVEKEGVHEWDETLEDNDEFESLDIKNGELDGDESDDKNDEECSLASNEVQENSVTEQMNATDDNSLLDLTNNELE